MADRDYVTFSVRIEQELLKALEAKKDALSRPRNWVVRQALWSGLPLVANPNATAADPRPPGPAASARPRRHPPTVEGQHDQRRYRGLPSVDRTPFMRSTADALFIAEVVVIDTLDGMEKESYSLLEAA